MLKGEGEINLLINKQAMGISRLLSTLESNHEKLSIALRNEIGII